MLPPHVCTCRLFMSLKNAHCQLEHQTKKFVQLITYYLQIEILRLSQFRHLSLSTFIQHKPGPEMMETSRVISAVCQDVQDFVSSPMATAGPCKSNMWCDCKKCPWSKNDCRPGAIKFIFLSCFRSKDLLQVAQASLNVKVSLSLSTFVFYYTIAPTWLCDKLRWLIL